jgi:ribosome-associated protein
MDIKIKKLLEYLEKEGLINIRYYSHPLNWIEHGIIATATSKRHINALLSKLKFSEHGKSSVYGARDSEWVILDFDHCVLHLFSSEKREYYDLDSLWGKLECLNNGV